MYEHRTLIIQFKFPRYKCNLVHNCRKGKGKRLQPAERRPTIQQEFVVVFFAETRKLPGRFRFPFSIFWNPNLCCCTLSECGLHTDCSTRVEVTFFLGARKIEFRRHNAHSSKKVGTPWTRRTLLFAVDQSFCSKKNKICSCHRPGWPRSSATGWTPSPGKNACDFQISRCEMAIKCHGPAWWRFLVLCPRHEWRTKCLHSNFLLQYADFVGNPCWLVEKNLLTQIAMDNQ